MDHLAVLTYGSAIVWLGMGFYLALLGLRQKKLATRLAQMEQAENG